jgi:hypothetical protein
VKGGSTADVCAVRSMSAFAVWILRYISRLTSFVGVIRDPRYTNSLTTSKCLSPIATLSGPQTYILSFVHLFLTLLWLLLFPMLIKHSKRLTDSYRRYLYHRHMRVVARRTITSSTTLKSSVDNTSPCLNPCRVSKDSEQSFCILTPHVTIVSLALVRRINCVVKLSSDIPT